MTSERLIVSGVLRNGVVVPDERLELLEGTQKQISYSQGGLSREEADEFAAWDRAGADTWKMIDEWEKEKP